jgi:hypothetical protein
MTDGEYIARAKILGKFAKYYDLAAASVTTFDGILATTADQIATGVAVDNPEVLSFAGYLSRLNNATVMGPTSICESIVLAAKAYLVLPLFYSAMTTEPAAITPAGVLAALQTEMSAAVDNKTFGTKTTSGIVNFLDVVLGAAGTWNTESDSTADYRDAVYCVSPVV